MTARENLNPTTVVDKNGRVTTVYRKPQAAPGRTSIPQVKSPSMTAARRKEMIGELALRYETTKSGPGGIRNLTKVLKTYPDELLERLEGMRVTNSPAQWIAKASVADGEFPAAINERLTFYPEVGHLNYRGLRMRVAALHDIPQLPESDDFTKESDEVVAQCRALLVVIDACNRAGLYGEYHDDPSDTMLRDDRVIELDDLLVDFVIAHPDHSVEIANFIRERKAIDLDLLTELVEGDARALGSGAL